MKFQNHQLMSSQVLWLPIASGILQQDGFFRYLHTSLSLLDT